MASKDSTFYDTIQFNSSDTIFSEIISYETEPTVKNELEFLKRETFINDWIILVFIFIFIMLAWIRVSSEKYLNSLFHSCFNFQTANRLFRERVRSILHPSFKLDVIFYIVTGLYIFHIESFYIEKLVLNDFVYFLINTALVMLYVNVKYLAYLFTSVLFNSRSETNEFIFYMKSNNQIMGVFLLPFSIIMFFTTGISFKIYLFLGFLTILFFSVSSLFRGFSIIAKKDFSIYYLILYLCTLEILPLLIVWRILW